MRGASERCNNDAVHGTASKAALLHSRREDIPNIITRRPGVHHVHEPKLENAIISTDLRDRDVWPPVLQLVAMLCRTTLW